MRILFAGTPSNAAFVLEGLIASGHEIVAVLTREDSLTGRKKVLTPSPVAEVANRHLLPLIKSNKLTKDVLTSIQEHKVELAVVVAYGVILDKSALESVEHGWYNLHFSHLPRWRGAAPVQRAIQAGDSLTGVSLFKIDEGLDTGPLLNTVDTVIEPDENSGNLLERLSSIGLTLLNQELPKLYSGTFTLTFQTGQASSAPKITRLEAKIDFAKSSSQVENLVRAMNPEPMAWCQLAGEPMRLLRARAIDANFELDLGEVVLDGDRVLVGCESNSVIELLEVQPASRTAMLARDWMNGQTAKVVLE